MESPLHDHPQIASTFVGRQRELAALQQHFAAASSGHGRWVLITGEAGVGKTSLAEQLAAQLSSAARVYWGRCWEHRGAPAFWPWRQILRECVRGPDRDNPYLRVLLGELPEPMPDATVDVERVRFKLFAAVSRVLRDAAAAQPLVLLFDDLHAADLDSLLLLEFLLRELSTTRWLVVATLREITAKDSPHRDHFFGPLGRAAARLPLGSLLAAEVEEYVRATMERKPSRRVLSAVGDLAGALFETTGGHPLFLKEALQLWLDDLSGGPVPSIALAVARLPQQLIETVRQRLRPLRQPTLELLTLAATLGRTFELGLLQRVHADHPVAASDARDWHVLDALDEAVNAAVIRRDAEKAGRYSFTHTLFREALYQEIPAARRARLHGQIAATMESLYLAGRNDLVPEIAFHQLEAAPAGAARKAIVFASLAAAQATSASAHHDAVAYRTQALQAFDLDVASGSTAAGLAQERCDLLLELGYAQNRAALRDVAKATFLDTAELARTLGDAQRLGGAALGYGGASSAAALGGVEVFRFDTPLSMEPMCSQLLSEALAAVGPAESTLRARLLSRLAVERYFVGSAAERDALSREACDLATRLGDPATLAVVIAERLAAIAGVDNLDERLALSAQAIPLAQAIGSRSLEILARSFRGVALLEAGDLTEMETNSQLARFLTEAEAMPIFLWGMKQRSAMDALLAGRFAEAEQLANEALQIGGGVISVATVVWMQQLHVIRRALGRHDEMVATEGIMKAGIEAFPMFPQSRIELAVNYMALGMRLEARAHFDHVAARGFSDIRRDLEWLHSMGQVGEVCCFLADQERGQRLYDLLLPFAGRIATTTFTSLCSGATARVLGMLAALLRNPERAAEHFEAALRANRALRSPPLLAQTQLAYATALVHHGDTDPHHRAVRLDRARTLLAEAMESARMLGMAPLLAQIEHLREHMQETRPAHAPPAPAAGASPDVQPLRALLRKEGDYWTLAYGGRRVRLKHNRGLSFLARLVRAPGREIASTELVASGDTSSAPTETVTSVRGSLGDAGDVLDATARTAYKQRIEDLRGDLQEAEQFNDSGRAERLQRELDMLTTELARAVGLGGRSRRAGAHSERARVNVTRALALTLRRIAAEHPQLGEHFARTIHTGTLCSYAPDPLAPIEWTADGG